jgi:hypothetical protein
MVDVGSLDKDFRNSLKALLNRLVGLVRKLS